MPQSVERLPGVFTLSPGRVIVLYGDATPATVLAARRFRDELAAQTSNQWEIRAAAALAETEGVVAVIDRRAVRRAEGYHLTIGDERIAIVARDEPGIAHAFSTLTQLVRQYGRRLPRLHIEDHPDFANRGVMLDVSRDRIPSMGYLRQLIDMLSEWKVNQFQLYMEHTFAYQQHRAVWKDASPFTGEEILALNAYCRDRNIELVPNQNSFGHMERWLKHKPYNDFAECPRGATKPWRMPPFTLDPSDPRSLSLISRLYEELLPHFSSRNFNVGCDETFDLGQGKSAALVKRYGAGHVYVDFLLKVHDLVTSHGRRMMFWGDIVMQHPELIRQIPRDVTVLEWGYEHDHPYDADTKAFKSAGLPFYVCPGAGGWNSFIGRTDNAIANIANAATNGRKRGAAGLLNTEWGDNGHMQPPPVAWLGTLFGAAAAWSPRTSTSIDLPAALSLHAFHDDSRVTGQAVYDLGNAYTVNGARTRNGSLLQQLYTTPIDSDWPMQRVRPGGFEDTREYIAHHVALISASSMRRIDASVIEDEFRIAATLADAGAQIGALKHARFNGAAASKLRAGWRRAAKQIEALIPEYEETWLGRSRPGGLPDSTKRLRETAAVLRAQA
jgi:hypothetical protein